MDITKKKPGILERFENAMERWSHRNIEDMRNKTIDEMNEIVKKEKGHINKFSAFPFIGRGNVNRDNVISHEDVEDELDEVLE